MSIQSEITRITSARDSSFTAVGAKGVTVPTGSTIDDLPGLINQIEAGGTSAVTSIVVGALWGTGLGTTYTTLSQNTSVTITPVHFADETYVTYANGIFTFVMDGHYQITYFGRGGYNNGGTSIRMYYQFLPGIGPVNNWPTGTNVVNTGISDSFTDNFTNGDTLYVQTRNNSGNNVHSFGFIIEYLDGGGPLPRALGRSF